MRRKLSFFLLAFIVFFAGVCLPASTNAQQIKPIPVQQRLAELEASSGGKLGVYAINTANNMHIEYHAEQRFPFQSTFKVLVVSAILKQSLTDSHLLQKKMLIKEHDLVFWSPVAEKHISDGMTISELSAAAIMHSDNAATNLLMKKLGGVDAINAYARSINDNTFKLHSWEPELNSSPTDMRDTSTPAAMGKDLQKLALGNLLALPQREQLIAWLKGNTTGDNRIRAGAPKGWIVGDKTGSGDYGTANDIAIIWPPKCSPIIVAIYFTNNKKDMKGREDVIASATRLLINEFAQTDQCIKLASEGGMK